MIGWWVTGHDAYLKVIRDVDETLGYSENDGPYESGTDEIPEDPPQVRFLGGSRLIRLDSRFETMSDVQMFTCSMQFQEGFLSGRFEIVHMLAGGMQV